MVSLICKVCGREWGNNIILSHHLQFHKITSKEYYDKFFKKSEDGICKECGSKTFFESLGSGYRVFCCKRCVQLDSNIQLRRKKTLLKNFGVDNPSKSKEVQKKKVETAIKNFGSLKAAYYDKAIETIKERYGVEHPSKLEKIKEKSRVRLKNGGSTYMHSFLRSLSKEELKIREMVLELYPDFIPNYKPLENRSYKLDLGHPTYKIAVEWDGWFHFDTEEHRQYHKKRQEEIEAEGWTFVRHNIFQKFPTKEQLLEDIKSLLE